MRVASEAALSHEHAPECTDTTLVFSGQQQLSNGWIQTYSIYTDDVTREVWGDGYAEDPESVDTTGTAGRWLSYTQYNGEFTFLGSDNGRPMKAVLGPDDVTWTWSQEDGWVPDFDQPSSGPQALWGVLILVAAAAILLSGDSGCSCGHSGGTGNHPGTNPPED